MIVPRVQLIAILLLAPAGASAQFPVRDAHGLAFQRLADGGPGSAVTLAFDGSLHARLSELHARGEAFEWPGLPLPGKLAVDLELRPVSAMAPDARAQVVRADGSVTLLAPRVRCFAGHVVGGGPVFLGASDGEINGYLSLGDDQRELYFLSAGESKRPGRAVIAHADQVRGGDPFQCGLPGGGPELPGRLVLEPPARLGLATPVLRTADVFVEADDQYRARFASDGECVDYTVLLFTAASEIYRRDLGVTLAIPDRYLRIWNQTPPWGVLRDFPDLKNVYTWWQSASNPLATLPRAAVHVLTHPVFGGTARGAGGLCSTVRAYEISSLNCRFPYPIQHTSRDNWDLFVVCHELGHTFGSVHSSDYFPPIRCDDGTGPDVGTLMSYCHTTYGMARIGMRFHPREQARIRGGLGTPKCLRSRILTLGDYDGDGDVDASDLTALRGVMTQGFRSSAAEEVLDMDGDLDVDDFDHDALALLVYGAPPARVTVRNGRDVNPTCLQALGNPILGKQWTVRILASEAGTPTLLVGYDEPLTGAATARGELLVRTAPYGGLKLFSIPSVSDGGYALHEFHLPLDAALFGHAVNFQGLVLDPRGEYYCNALDVVLSPYE